MAGKFDLMSFTWRFVLALVLVLLTYNPTGYSYFDWFGAALAAGTAGPEHYFAGVVLIIGWVIFLRATFRSLSGFGILLGAAFLGTLLWLLTEYKIVPADSTTAITWITLVCMAALLAIGMSWSHIRRRLTGQYDVDDVED
ncbi:MAG: DUF6524 family protein [Gammaproteobacteria bacterium]|nr:DUF6524 family protein [Gammaproteobacteria bacterium]